MQGGKHVLVDHDIACDKSGGADANEKIAHPRVGSTFLLVDVPVHCGAGVIAVSELPFFRGVRRVAAVSHMFLLGNNT